MFKNLPPWSLRVFSWKSAKPLLGSLQNFFFEACKAFPCKLFFFPRMLANVFPRKFANFYLEAWKLFLKSSEASPWKFRMLPIGCLALHSWKFCKASCWKCVKLPLGCLQNFLSDVCKISSWKFAKFPLGSLESFFLPQISQLGENVPLESAFWFLLEVCKAFS